MSYADKDLERATTRKRVKKHRANKKGVTKGVTGEPKALIFPDSMGRSPEELRGLAHKIIENAGAVCPICGGRGFTELEHGLRQIQCECQRKTATKSTAADNMVP